MWALTDVERNLCPAEFQDRLSEVGGVNRYDQPNFVLYWGQTETFRAGGFWEQDGYHGYRDLLLGHGDPSWLLCQWQPGEVYGTPESYYVQNYDEATGLQILGEYPYSGRYRVLFPLIWKGMVGSELKVEHFPLSNMLIDLVIPIVLNAKEVSAEQQRAAAKELKDREDSETLNRIEDAKRAAAIPFGGNAVSFARQGCRTSILDQKVKQIEQNWARAAAMLKSLGPGLSQR